MLKEESYLTDYDMCVALSKIGYCQGSNYGIVKYAEDYIYDEDPTHPESHKKGDIEIVRFYTKNKEDNNVYEVPLIYEVGKWLRENKHIIISIKYDIEDKKYIGFLYNISTGVETKCYSKIFSLLNSYEEVYKKCIKEYIEDMS